MICSSKSAAIAALTFALLASTSAFAADTLRPYPSARTAPAQSWSGFYGGPQIGFGSGKTSTSSDLGGGLGSIDTSGSISGGFGGLNVGYNFQFDNIVFGPEADFKFGSQKGTASQDALVGGFLPVNITTDANLNWTGTIGGRLGYDLNGWLFYGTAGWAFGQASISGVASSSGFQLGTFNTTKMVHGSAFGLGLEKRLTGNWSNWSAKLEYQRQNFGSFDVTANTIFGPVTTTGKITDNVVKAGLNYHF